MEIDRATFTELMHVIFAEQDSAGGFELGDHGGVFLGAEIVGDD